MMHVYMTTYDAYENRYSVRLRLASPVASNGVDNTGACFFVDPHYSGSVLRDLDPLIMGKVCKNVQGHVTSIKRCSGVQYGTVRCGTSWYQMVRRGKATPRLL